MDHVNYTPCSKVQNYCSLDFVLCSQMLLLDTKLTSVSNNAGESPAKEV